MLWIVFVVSLTFSRQFQDKRIVLENNSAKTEFTLTVRDCTCEDAGTYMLQAENSHGRIEE